jgi:Tol biopolymer transport system component
VLWSALVLGVLALPGASVGAAGPYVYVIPAAGGPARVLGPGSDPVVSPDGTEVAYVREDHVWRMRADGGEQRELTAGFGAGPVWSPDGIRLVYTLWNVDPCYPPPKTKCAITDIWTVNVDGSGERKLLPHALEPAWSPDGRLLLYREFAGPAEADMPVGPLKVARADGSRVRTLSDGVSSDGTSSRAAWSPDGKWVVFERSPPQPRGIGSS